MGTFATIKTRVQRRVIDLPAAVQAEVPDLVNMAMKTLQTKHNFKVMEKTSIFLTTSGSYILTSLPSDWKEWNGHPILLNPFSSGDKLVWSDGVDGTLRTFSPIDIGRPEVLRVAEMDDAGTANIEVLPLPDTSSDWVDGNYHVMLPYWRYLPALSADGDNNWLTNNGEEFIVNQAVAEGFLMDWNYQDAAVWEARANKYFKEVVDRDKMYRLSGVTSLVPHWRGADSPLIGG